MENKNQRTYKYEPIPVEVVNPHKQISGLLEEFAQSDAMPWSLADYHEAKARQFDKEKNKKESERREFIARMERELDRTREPVTCVAIPLPARIQRPTIEKLVKAHYASHDYHLLEPAAFKPGSDRKLTFYNDQLSEVATVFLRYKNIKQGRLLFVNVSTYDLPSSNQEKRA